MAHGKRPRPRWGESGQASLVALVVVAALGLLLVWVLMGRPKPPEPAGPAATGNAPAGQPQTTYGAAVDQARDVACMNNLSQIRTALRIAVQTGIDEGPPPTLRELQSQGISASMTLCPVSRQPYRYNPQNGQVSCATPGHQQY